MRHHLSCYECPRGYTIRWEEVTEILGHEHEASPADDALLVAALRTDGAIIADHAEGWISPEVWGITGGVSA